MSISAGLLGAVTHSNLCNMAAGHYNPRPASPADTCMIQVDGMMTINIWGSLIEIPNPGQAAGTFQAGHGIELIDSHCNVVGGYTWDTCGIPAIIKEDFLPGVLTVNSVQADVGGTAMTFEYAGVSYDTKSSKRCKCWSEAVGLAEKGFCTCEFPTSLTPPPYYTTDEPASVIPPPRKSKRAPRVEAEVADPEIKW